MRAIILVALSLMLNACGKKKTCEQPTETYASIENRTQVDLKLEFLGTENRKDVPKVLELKPNSTAEYLMGKGIDVHESTYGKADFTPHDPTCTSTPDRYGLGLPGVTSASFNDVKVCWPKYTGPSAIVIGKSETCPADSWEQLRPQDPGTR